MEIKSMSKIISCNMNSCAYNAGEKCHTPGISVGHHAECNTYTHASPKGGSREISGGVGACVASDCKFNDKLECTAGEIDVSGHEIHADCIKFCLR